MSTPLFNSRFTILLVDENDKLVGIIPSYTNLATYLGASISLGVAASRTLACHEWYVGYANMVCPQAPGNWRENLSDTEVAGLFDYKMRDFPPVFPIRTVPNPDLMGWFPRLEAGGHGDDFVPRRHCICVNGLKVEEMCKAGVVAENSGKPDSQETKDFQTHMVAFAITIMHELTHMYGTFLGGGKMTTPPEARAFEPDADPTKGDNRDDVLTKGKRAEAGQFMEKVVLGGLVSVFEDPDNKENRAGVLYLINEKGTKRITRQAIKDFIQYKFEFPFAVGEEAPASLTTLGGNRPVLDKKLLNPLLSVEAIELLREQERKPIDWDMVMKLMEKNPKQKMTPEDQSILRKVSLQPSLRLPEVPKAA